MSSKTIQFRRACAPFLALAAVLYGAASAAAQAAPQTAAPVLLAKFDQEISSKSAHPGDAVSARVLRELKVGSIDIAKGSKIVGLVTAAQSKKDGNGNSSLAIHFDRVEMKDNKVLPIAGLIVAIGEVDNDPGLGSFSVLSRGGVGSTPGTDTSAETARKHQDEVPDGSSLEGVALAKSLDAGNASRLRGAGRDIECDTNTEIKVALYRAR